MNSKRLIGSWKLLSMEHRREDGTVFLPFGEKVTGQLIYSDDGYMCVAIMKANRKKIKSRNLFAGDLKEKGAAAENYISYAGTYDVTNEMVVHKVKVSLFPNWVGTEQKRFYRLQGSRLELNTTAFPGLDGRLETAYLTWERMKSR